MNLLHLLLKALKRPSSIWRCLWVYYQLWWVNSRLQTLAISALQDPISASVPPLSSELQQEIDRRVALISWISRRHPCNPQCLHRSLVLYGWLRHKSIPARLNIGWGDRIGHAWVSYGAQILNDRPEVVQSIFTPSISQPQSNSPAQ